MSVWMIFERVMTANCHKALMMNRQLFFQLFLPSTRDEIFSSIIKSSPFLKERNAEFDPQKFDHHKFD